MKNLEFPKDQTPRLDECTSVVIRRGTEREFYGQAVPLECPTEHFKQLVEESEISEDGLSMTLGIIMAKNDPSVDHKNWIKSVLNVDRIILLKQACHDALFKTAFNHKLAFHMDFPIKGVNFMYQDYAQNDPELFGYLVNL